MEKVECPQCGRKFDTRDAMSQHTNDKHGKHEAVVPAGVRKPKLTVGKILTYGIILLVVGGIVSTLVWALTSPSAGRGPVGSAHIHQDYAVYINGERLDFSAPKYYVHVPYVHMHEPHNTLIHVHATGVTMGDFLEGILGIKLTAECITVDGVEYCNDGDKTVKFYVNGERNSDFSNYMLRDLDKILISYGNESEEEIMAQLESITNLAFDASTGLLPG